ncbi:MAG: alpha/beta fold hydrolase [Candidatus Moranbacteria bacterium]|nr:alpha/beta fold hydrolase [Candidatus Moranbacteria bacterium]
MFFCPWRNISIRLASPVSAPFLRGHGTVPEDLEGVVWRDWLEDVQEAFRDLKKESSKIFIAGSSMGGDLAMLLSEEKDVSGVISLGTPIEFHFQFLAESALRILGAFKTYRRKYYPPWVSKDAIDPRLYPYYPIASAQEVVKLAKYTGECLLWVTKPILIAQSTSDHLVSKKSPQIIFDRSSSSQKEIYWVENGHHVFVEKEEIWKKIEDFIKLASQDN